MAELASPSVDVLDAKLAKFYIFCVYAYIVVTVSCAFPPGFVSTLSILTFLLSLLITATQYSAVKLLCFEKIGVYLITSIAIISLFFNNNIRQLLIELFEYRLYFFTPFIAIAFAKITTSWRVLLNIIWLSGYSAVIASYLIYFDLFFIDTDAHSLANRIYHGFVLGMTGAINIYFIQKSRSFYRIFFWYILLFLLISNLFFIENGRTGFIIGCLLCFYIILIRKRKILDICLMSIIVVSMSISPNAFKDRIFQSLVAFEDSIVYQDYQSSIGHRLVFYQRGFELIKDSPIFGVGLIDAEPALKGSKLFPNVVTTDNVHSEFLNITIIGGVVSLFIFISYLYSIGFAGYRQMKVNPPEGWLIVYITSVFIIQSLFNSSVKDFGDKNLIIVMLVLVSLIIRRQSSGNLRRA